MGEWEAPPAFAHRPEIRTAQAAANAGLPTQQYTNP
jgi:hypothetical protein